MPRRPRVLVLLLALLLVSAVAGCSSTSSGSSSSGGVRCLDRNSGGQGSTRASEEPDRPLFFLFCVQSP
jgi:hypothetical protein